MPALAWNDINQLATLAAERADYRGLAMDERERLADLADRVISGTATARDVRDVAALAEADAALQGDAKVRQRYTDLARRARESAA